jgi:Zn finger protein HypA/HybF involved in hydrogenase expression
VHDYHAVKALIDHLTADRDLDQGILEVQVEASAEFSPEALAQAYEMLTQGTRFEGSRLVVAELVEHRQCASCGADWTLTPDEVIGHLVVCPLCGATSLLGSSTGLRLVNVRKRQE